MDSVVREGVARRPSGPGYRAPSRELRRYGNHACVSGYDDRRLVIDALASPGVIPESARREDPGARIGRDFSRVRVHTEGTAARPAWSPTVQQQTPAVAQSMEGQQDEPFAQSLGQAVTGAIIGGALGAVVGAATGGRDDRPVGQQACRGQGE